MKRTGSKSKLEGDESFCSDGEVCTVSQHVRARETKGGAVETHEGGLCWSLASLVTSSSLTS